MNHDRVQEMAAWANDNEEPVTVWPTWLVVLTIYGGGTVCWLAIVGLLYLVLG